MACPHHWLILLQSLFIVLAGTLWFHFFVVSGGGVSLALAESTMTAVHSMFFSKFENHYKFLFLNPGD
jgi:hypothetical protein